MELKDLFIWLKKDGQVEELDSWEDYCKALKSYPSLTGLVVVNGLMTINHVFDEVDYAVGEKKEASIFERIKESWKRKSAN